MTTISRSIFDAIVALAKSENSEDLLLEYCRTNLGSIEKLFFDYKEKEDRSTPEFSENDKRNLAKAISGFANTNGGILIWGIKNENLHRKPITNITQFVQNMQKLAIFTTEPVVPNIESNFISADGITGYGLIHIPESDISPHRVILNNSEIKNHYYIRTGESFAVAPHVLLEDMFGRRPHPKIGLFTKIHIRKRSNNPVARATILVGIVNNGRGPAKSPYMEMAFNDPYQYGKNGIDGNNKLGLDLLPVVIGTKSYRFSSGAGVVIFPNMELPVASIDYDINTAEDFIKIPDLTIKYRIGADGIEMKEGDHVVTIASIFHETTIT
jgi:hypothetical protein